MPSIRHTPSRATPHRFGTADDSDHGFDPEWAKAPAELPMQASPIDTRKMTIENSNYLAAPPVEVTAIDSVPTQSTKREESFRELAFLGIAMLPGIGLYTLENVTKKTISTIVGRTVAMSRKFRFNPMSRGGRSPKRTPRKQKPEKGSMFEFFPYMAGATPKVLRLARGQNPHGMPEPAPLTDEEVQKWNLFHENTPIPNKIRRVLETPAKFSTTPQGPQDTPYVPASRMQSLTTEFYRNHRKEEVVKWVRALKKYGITTAQLRKGIVENYSLPTEALWNQKSPGGPVFDYLVKCLSHRGFIGNYRINPVVQHPAPIPKRLHGHISKESVTQQRDRCCRFCRGYSWAGKAERRKLLPDGTVPVKSRHKSIEPYTDEEKTQFSQGKYDMMFRRWCQESRYDWLFEKPDIRHPQDWQISDDDPRLRHIAMMGLQNQYARNAKKMYDTDRVDYRNQTIKALSRQDLAAAAFIEAIRREDSELVQRYEQMDIERKRRQVKPEWLCIRQVKVEKAESIKPKPQPIAKLAPEKNSEKKVEERPGKRRASDSPVMDAVEKGKIAVPLTVSKRVKFAGEPAGPSKGTPYPKGVKGILKISNDAANQSRQPSITDNIQKPQSIFGQPDQHSGDLFTNILKQSEPKDPLAHVDFTKGYVRGGPNDPLHDLPMTQEFAEYMNRTGQFWQTWRAKCPDQGWKVDPLLSHEENERNRINYLIRDYANSERVQQGNT